MGSFFHFILVFIFSYLAGVFIPVWWSVAVAVFLVTLILPGRPGKRFFSAFASVFLLWSLLDFIADIRNDHILASRMSMLIIKRNAPWALGLISAFLGGLVAGFAALPAAYLRMQKKEKKLPFAA